MTLPVTDFGVLITRPAGKADNLLAGLDELSSSYMYQPLITTQMMPLRHRDVLHLQSAELIIFVSVSAVTCLEQQFDLKSLTAKIEPILIAIVAVMVLILALGIFTPMWDMLNAYKGTSG